MGFAGGGAQSSLTGDFLDIFSQESGLAGRKRGRE